MERQRNNERQNRHKRGKSRDRKREKQTNKKLRKRKSQDIWNISIFYVRSYVLEAHSMCE